MLILLHATGYNLTKFTIRPFGENDLTNDPDEADRRRHWNYRLSHLRIAVEHAFGRLKGRFAALRALSGINLDFLYKCLEAILVIHNILTQLGDDPMEIDGFNGAEDRFVVQRAQGRRREREIANMTEDELYVTGVARRKFLLEQ